MNKIVSVALEGSNAIHGRAIGATVAGAGDGAEFYVTLCRPEPGKRPYVPVSGEVTCRTCGKVIRESGATVADGAPEPVATVEREAANGVKRVLTSLRTARVYVDNGGNLYGCGFPSGALQAVIRSGLARVNGASRVRLDNGRTGRRIVLTIAGRNALNA